MEHFEAIILIRKNFADWPSCLWASWLYLMERPVSHVDFLVWLEKI